MAYTSKQLDSRKERDQVNVLLRASPEWRSTIQSFGLNPDGPLKLTKTQQQAVARRFGLPESDFHIDPAGNINDFHGWKGLPTAAKVAIITAAVVTGYGALPGAMIGTGAGSTIGALTGAGAGALPVAGAGLAPASYVVPGISSLGAGGGIGATAGTTAALIPGSAAAQAMVPSTVGGFTTPGVGSVATTVGTSGAGTTGAGMTTLDKVNTAGKVANYATDFFRNRSQGKANQEALDYQRAADIAKNKLLAEQRLEDQEIARKKVERDQLQWDAQQAEIKRKADLEESRFAESEARKAPYRAGGMQTLARLNAGTQPTRTPYQSQFMGPR